MPTTSTRGQAVETAGFLRWRRIYDREADQEVVVFTPDLHALRVAALFIRSGIKPRVVAVRYQGDRNAPRSVFWMRFGRWGYRLFERLAALRDRRHGWITKEQFRAIKRGEMPEGISLEIVEVDE